MPYSISDAKICDIKELEELEQRVFIPSDGLLNSRSFRYHIQKNKNILLVARTNEPPHTLVGYILVILNNRSARIYSLAVIPEYQKQGVGRELSQAAIGKIKNRDINSIHLELRKENKNALRLYESLGFVFSGVRADYYGHYEDAIVMTWNK